MMSMPYEYPFAGTLGYSYTGADFAWGNSGTWIGHPQYPWVGAIRSHIPRISALVAKLSVPSASLTKSVSFARSGVPFERSRTGFLMRGLAVGMRHGGRSWLLRLADMH